MIHVKASFEVFLRPASFSYPEVKYVAPVLVGIVCCLFTERFLRDGLDRAGPVTRAYSLVWIELGQSDFAPPLVSCTGLFRMKLAEIPARVTCGLCDITYYE